jgi:hypothetical protein
MNGEKFSWKDRDLTEVVITANDPVRLREALEEFRAERVEVRECGANRHAGRTASVKFNGGDPWVICSYCGTKLRNATDEDLGR